jgi:hypothetical protein
MEMENGERHIKAFRVHRWVEAESEIEAGRVAVELLRSDRRLRGQLTVRLIAEEIEEVSGGAIEENRSGFLFYESESQVD